MRATFLLSALTWLIVLAVAAAFRLPDLRSRPMHADEANQAVRTAQLWETGEYRYDPDDHHGPSLYWLTLPSLWANGVDTLAESDEFDYRIVPAIFGIALLLLALLMADGLGGAAAVAGAALASLSPAMIFHARYFIQETLLVFFTVAAIGCAWRFFRGGRYGWAVAAGAAVGFMHVTKETWILSAAAMAAGLAVVVWTLRKEAWTVSMRRLAVGAGMAVLAAVVVAVAFYSSFGRNWRGPLDSILAYRIYFQRGAGGGAHSQPWHYYLGLLLAYRPAKGFFWTEAFIAVLALIGVVAAFRRRWPLGRFLVVYAAALTALYAAIPYKTPWCLLGFWHATILVAGIGAAALLSWTPSRWGKAAVAVLLLTGAAHLGREAYWLNFRLAADARNPFCYVHTTRDVLNLAPFAERLAAVAPEGHAMTIHVVKPDNYWPLPWYLRQFTEVGYWDDAAKWRAETAAARPPAMLLVDTAIESEIDPGLKASYNRQMLVGLRPGVVLRALVREDLQKKIAERFFPPPSR